MRWLASGADASVVLTSRPTECLAAAPDPETDYEVEIGRAAFRTPLLLGGQAARAGLSCESCHRSGRNNPAFDFPGISGGRPGAADVGTSVLSSHRGGKPLNPVPIPDLSAPKSALKTPQDPSSGQLEDRIRTIDTQEFDGPEPAPGVLKGLAAYVRALSPTACPASPREPVTAAAALDDVRRTLKAALAAIGRRDGAAAALMVESARSQLGDIDERYPGADLVSARETLSSASGDLVAAEADARAGRWGASEDITLWLAHESRWAGVVIAVQSRSLYDPARLAAAAGAYAAGRPPSSTLN